MKLTFLGTGSAFTVGDGNYQSNMLLEARSGRRLLIDCGSDIRFSLHEQGLKLADITDLYISHLHADHIGGLEGLAFSTFFAPGLARPRLFTSVSLVDDLWSRSLSGGLGSIEGHITNLDTYFDVQAIGRNGGFTWEGVYFQLVQVIHYMDGFNVVPSFGLMFQVNETKIFLTTDTQHAPNQIGRFYDMADIIFQDCETAQYKSGVHAHYSELVTMPPQVKAKMWLYHYQPGARPDGVADGFAGFVQKGQVFEFNEPAQPPKPVKRKKPSKSQKATVAALVGQG